MSGKSKASDRTNLDTSAAPINCQYNPVKLKFTILLFFYNSRFMKIIQHQIPVIQDPSPVKMAFKTVIRSLVWLTAVRKLFLLYRKTTEYSLPLLFCQSSSNQIQNILYIPCFRVFRIIRILQYSMYSAIPPNRVTQISGTTS